MESNTEEGVNLVRTLKERFRDSLPPGERQEYDDFKNKMLSDTSPSYCARLFKRGVNLRADLKRHRAHWYFREDGEVSFEPKSEEEMITMVIGFFASYTIPAKGDDIKYARVGKHAAKDILAAFAAINGVSLPDDLSPPFFFDGTQPDLKEKLIVADGIVDMMTGKFEPVDSDFFYELFAVNTCPVRYDPDAPEPKAWLEFLDSIWGDDEKSKLLLRQWMIYCLSSDTSRQRFMHYDGQNKEGREGKGLIQRVQIELAGGINRVAAPSINDLADKFGLGPLVNKSLAVMTDESIDNRTSISAATRTLRKIIGEDAVQIDFKHVHPAPFRLQARIAIGTNPGKYPFKNDVNLNGKKLTLKFHRSFWGKEDLTLEKRIMGELPSILKWAVGGYPSLKKDGFVEPEYSSELADKCNPRDAFVRDMVIVDDGGIIQKDALHAAFKKYCAKLGVAAECAETFAKWIKNQLQISEGRPRSHGRKTVWFGIKLKSPTRVKSVKAEKGAKAA